MSFSTHFKAWGFNPVPPSRLGRWTRWSRWRCVEGQRFFFGYRNQVHDYQLLLSFLFVQHDSFILVDCLSTHVNHTSLQLTISGTRCEICFCRIVCCSPRFRFLRITKFAFFLKHVKAWNIAPKSFELFKSSKKTQISNKEGRKADLFCRIAPVASHIPRGNFINCR